MSLIFAIVFILVVLFTRVRRSSCWCVDFVAVGNTGDIAVAGERPSSFDGVDNDGSVVVDTRAIVDHDSVAAVRRQDSNNTLQQHVDVAVAQDTARR